MKWKRYQSRRKRKQQQPEISLTPMIDTALTLLIIFMVTSPMLVKENALEIELPKGNIKEISDTTKQEIIVSVDKKGRIALNDTIIPRKNLITLLSKKVGKDKNKTVFVKGDTAAQFGTIIELVDAIKHVGGIGYVALATEKITRTA